MDKITDEMILEGTGVKEQIHHPFGYGKPADKITTILLTHNTGDYGVIRSASGTIPGNLPIGTRFKITIEQVDEVTSATIKRGALPNIIEDKLLVEGDLQ